jgi:hypothetical protein
MRAALYETGENNAALSPRQFGRLTQSVASCIIRCLGARAHCDVGSSNCLRFRQRHDAYSGGLKEGSTTETFPSLTFCIRVLQGSVCFIGQRTTLTACCKLLFPRTCGLSQWHSTFFSSRTLTCNLSSTLCPSKLLAYNSSYTQSITYI